MPVVTASRNSRSWLITSMVPPKRRSHCSSHSTASRSRWLVGSSSSSKSAGLMSARANCSRMRQPPLKLFTACSSASLAKPSPSSSDWARARAS